MTSQRARPNEATIVALLYETAGHLTVPEIALQLGASRRTIYNLLPLVLELGVQEHKSGRQTFYSLHSTAPPQTRRKSLQAYYDSDEWKHMRELAMQHYGALCVLCGTKDKLRVHHRTYERLGRERLSDLTVLCDSCHARYHGKTA